MDGGTPNYYYMTNNLNTILIIIFLINNCIYTPQES